MLGLSVPVALACIGVVFVGAAIQASIGIGLGMIAAPFLTLVDPDFVPVAIVICVVPLTVTIAWADRTHIDGRGFWVAILGRLPGVVVGAMIASAISNEVLALLVAGSVLAAVVLSATRVHFHTSDATVFGAGAASGFTGTAVGVGGPPIALVYQHNNPEVMRSTLSAFFAIGAPMSIAALAVAGEVGTRELQLSLMLIPGVIGGTILARRVKHLLDPRWLRPAVLALCAFTSITLLVETFL
jgi:uncharacterized membrane protein YfcA